MDWLILILGLLLIIGQIACFATAKSMDKLKKDIDLTFVKVKRLIGCLAFVFNIILYILGFLMFLVNAIDLTKLLIIFIVMVILGIVGITLVFCNKKAKKE